MIFFSESQFYICLAYTSYIGLQNDSRTRVVSDQETISCMYAIDILSINDKIHYCTVLPAKSDSEVMFSFQSYLELKSTDHLCINPIHKRSVDSR